MRTPSLSTPLEGAVVHPVRTDFDEAAMWQWLQGEHLIAVDTETCGLDFHDGARLLQVANGQEAWVMDAHRHRDVLNELAYGNITLLAHNAAFDATVIGHLLVDGDLSDLPGEVMGLMGSIVDTQILSTIIDPRSDRDGGIGHGLKPLADHYLGAGAIDGQTELKSEFRSLGLNMTSGWRNVPLWNETYLRYAGIDPILTFRLFKVLAPMVTELGLDHLSRFEHEVAAVCAGMTARGVKVDVPHAKATLAHLIGEQAAAESSAAFYGVENVNSPKQVAEGLLVRGIELTEKTDTGQWKVDKTVLDAIDDPLATLVKRAKASGKAAKSWIEPFLEHAAVDGRVHARIQPRKARTGRMAMDHPNLQNVPTGDYRIRRCLIPDEHQAMVSVDFSQVEVRVMAYLAEEHNLIEAFSRGLDVYSTIADRLFGSGWAPEKRAIAKMVVLAKCYGASTKKLALQAGVTEIVAKQAMAALDRSYPRLARWSQRTIERARFQGGVMTTPSGRRLPVDRGHEYKLLNHLVQATAADVFKGALLEVDRAGYGDRLLLPIHDELLLQGDAFIPDELGMVVADLMSGHLGDVPLVATHTVCGPSWGHAYMPEVAAHA